jgi:hypothetical protein
MGQFINGLLALGHLKALERSAKREADQRIRELYEQEEERKRVQKQSKAVNDLVHVDEFPPEISHWKDDGGKNAIASKTLADLIPCSESITTIVKLNLISMDVVRRAKEVAHFYVHDGTYYFTVINEGKTLIFRSYVYKNLLQWAAYIMLALCYDYKPSNMAEIK